MTGEERRRWCETNPRLNFEMCTLSARPHRGGMCELGGGGGEGRFQFVALLAVGLVVAGYYVRDRYRGK